MANSKPKRLTAPQQKNDADSLKALKMMNDYAPLKQSYSLANVLALFDDMDVKKEKEVQMAKAAVSAADDAIAAENLFHQTIQAVKVQIKAQYGTDSNEVQSIGLKKKSDYKRPVRKPKGK